MRNIQKIIFNTILWLVYAISCLSGCHTIDSFFNDNIREPSYDYQSSYKTTSDTAVNNSAHENKVRKAVNNNVAQPTATTLTSAPAATNNKNKVAVPLDAPVVPSIVPTVGQ